MKTKKVLLVSCSLIVICMSVMIGTAYALFTGSANVNNHLKAGDLKVTLSRTALEYEVLNEDGELQKYTVDGNTNFTSNTGNVFGISSENAKIVPGSYFKADMQIANKGSTAFTYKIGIRSGVSNELAQQLNVTVKVGDSVVTKKLSELTGDGVIFADGELAAAENSTASFTVTVEFVSDPDNNDAMNGEADFDLFVEATQKVAQSNG